MARTETKPEKVRLMPLTSSTTPWLPDEHNLPDTLAPLPLTVTSRPTSRRSSVTEELMAPLFTRVEGAVARLASWTPFETQSRENSRVWGESPSLNVSHHRTVAWNFAMSHGPA